LKTLDSVTDVLNAIMDFRADHGGEVPERLRARFRELSGSPSPVDRMVGVGEFIWANRAELPQEAKELGAGVIAFCTLNGFHGLLDDNRGDRIVSHLRAEMGEIKSPVGAEPDGKVQYLVQETEQPAPPPAG